MELIEGVGESSTPLRSSFGGFGGYDIRIDVYNRLVENGNEEAVCNPEFRDQLDAHFNRLPVRYGLDVNMDRVEDVLLHQKLLAQAKDPNRCPVFNVRFMENILTKSDGNVDIQQSARALSNSRESCIPEPEGVLPLDNRNSEIDFEPCSKLEDLNLDIRKNAEDVEGRYVTENLSKRYKEKRWDSRRLVGSGGMPLSHSATVTALAVAIGFHDGTQGSTFALAVILAAVVMYDASGVRLHARRQAEQLGQWQWESATSGAIAGFATVATLHPLDVVRTRFQVNDGRVTKLPLYKNTTHAIFTIARMEGLKGLYAGFCPAVLGSTVSWGLYFFFYNRAKQRYSKGSNHNLSAGLHLVSAAEAGGLVCLFTNPIWLVKTRLQLQTPLHQTRPYSGFYDALKTILKEEGWRGLYKGMGPGLLLVSHGAIQFTAYEELRKLLVGFKDKEGKANNTRDDKFLNSVDYAILGASSKLSAMLLTYPYQVIRARLQQRPSTDGTPKYMGSWHVVKDTMRFEGFRGLYKGITANLLKNVPAASITFVVYENVVRLLKRARRKED